MATQKQEKQINKLYAKIKELKLDKEDINDINIKGFLYSVSRINILQITAFLTIMAKKHDIEDEEIYDLLKD